MPKEKILVIGACGQIGVELVLALRREYGPGQVIAADLKSESMVLKTSGPFVHLDCLNREGLAGIIASVMEWMCAACVIRA